MAKLTDRLTPLTPPARAAMLFLIYAAILAGSFLLGYLVRFDFDVPADQAARWPKLLGILLPLQLVSLFFFGQFRSLLTYFSLPDLKRLFFAVAVPAVLMLALRYTPYVRFFPPRSIIILDAIVCFVGIAGMRTGFRVIREKLSEGGNDGAHMKRVAILGAGNSGARLHSEIRARPGLNLKVVCYLDDDPRKSGTLLHGVPVVGKPDDIGRVRRDLQISKAIIAMPNAPAARIREVVALLNAVDLEHDILPTLAQSLKSGAAVLSLRHVQIEDLLGRDAVDLNAGNIRAMVEGKTLLVTGAGGSIGSEICRQISLYDPGKVILLERSEAALFLIEQELLKTFPAEKIMAFPADINDAARVEAVISKHRPSVIFHAAAHKHVPMMESHPAEAVTNNLIGTRTIARLAARHGTERFVLISSDKAVRPTNVMGATKRLAEIYLQALQREPGAETRFLAVRFGNVLGSSGSVIPIFQSQIAKGGPVTVTHPEVMRYFMTIPEAVGLVLQCAAEGGAGDVFVLDMGHPMRIVDVARQLIELSGLRPEEDIKIHFTGLRPGEKMSEEVTYENEILSPTHHPKIRKLSVPSADFPDLDAEWAKVEQEIVKMDPAEVKAWINRLVPEYAVQVN
ncbi:MAG: nucleoside-diphosphate sugar epimerase/dehydratase [Terrimicrobiaceae bacterium]